MANNKKAMQAGTRTASNTALDTRNHTESDPLMGWFNLAKPSRDRQQKKSWKRKQRGQVCLPMVANLLLTAAALVLFFVALMGWAS